jgi:hypothetical protein
MKLSQDDADFFFRLMWGLQLFVNRRLGLLPKINTPEKYARLATPEKLEVRNALFEHPELIAEYVTSNPDRLPAEELEIVESWQRFIAGEFMVERFLKKGAIFIGSHDPPNVYLVLGLHSSIEEILPAYGAPYYAKTVLLPFRERIIYDGLLESYSVIFGSGIRSSLREAYLRAKQRGEIIENLTAPVRAGTEAPARPTGAAPDLGPALDEIVSAAEKLKVSNAPVASAALAVLRASALLAREAARDPGDLAALWECEEKTRRALIRLEKTLNRAG